jgi:ankyrin repeat protein
MQAAEQGHAELVDLLVHGGADLEARDKAGETALIIAANLGRDQVATPSSPWVQTQTPATAKGPRR